MKDNALISVRGLEKSFGKDIQVLKGIDIDIFKGDHQPKHGQVIVDQQIEQRWDHHQVKRNVFF